jgi:multidrug efflux pump subunit AcrA (membrane-fusion protein)
VRTPERIQRPNYVAASGTVEAIESVDLGFQVAGRVARVYIDEGQNARRGQCLAELEATDYEYGLQAAEGQAGVAQASLDKARAGTRAEELEQAKVVFERAEDDYKRYRQLYERKSMAAADFSKVEAAYRAARAQYQMAQNGARVEDRAAAGSALKQAEAQVAVSRKRVADTRLLAPLGGVLARRNIDPGEMVSAGLPAFTIMSLDPVRVRAGVPETDVGRVHKGQRARISIPALDGRQFTGTVDLVGVAADPASRTFSIRIVVPNPGLLLKAGMIAEANIEGSGTVDTLVIPGEAVVHDSQGSTLVYVYYPSQKQVHARRVEAGSVRDRGIEIVSGLTPGDLVVVAGQHKVREGALVEVVQ